MKINAIQLFPLFLALICLAVQPVAVAQGIIFDDMGHADPDNNGWFSFGSDIGGGGYSINSTDSPPDVGGASSLNAGFGGAAGFIGGFGRTNLLDLSTVDHFNFWISPAPDQSYTLEINLQDDDNGDDLIPNPSLVDDEYQFNCELGPQGACAIAGGGWQLVEIPFSELFDDNSFHSGGNGTLDAVPVSAGGNGQLVNIIFAVIGTGTDVNFVTDFWNFSSGALSTANEDDSLPRGFDLAQNYPNPFNPSTSINFTLPQVEQVNLSVFNLLGQRVATLISGATLQAGPHRVSFNADNLPTGIYIYRLDAGSFSQSRRMTLVR